MNGCVAANPGVGGGGSGAILCVTALPSSSPGPRSVARCLTVLSSRSSTMPHRTAPSPRSPDGTGDEGTHGMQLRCATAIVALCSSVAVAEEPVEKQPEPTLAPAGDATLPSTAIDERKEEESTDGKRYALVAGEIALLMGLGAAWYWNDVELQRPDWVLKWDTESWKMKLNGEAIRFDTNEFHINAFGHTSQAVLAYHAGRG